MPIKTPSSPKYIMIIYDTDKIDVYCIGDIHGEFGALMNFADRFLSDCAIICCGDIGMGFHKKQYYTDTFAKLNHRLSEKNVEFYMLRGNHDDPSYFDGKHDYGVVHLVPDYSVVRTGDGKGILMIGGAVSVDRTNRIINDRERSLRRSDFHYTYWRDEMPAYDPVKLDGLLKSNIGVNVVCTHTCPSFCFPRDKSGIKWFCKVDTKLADDIDVERSIMDKIWKWLCEHDMKPQFWCYGHYHKHNSEEIDGTQFVLLDMCYVERSTIDAYQLRLS